MGSRFDDPLLDPAHWIIPVFGVAAAAAITVYAKHLENAGRVSLTRNNSGSFQTDEETHVEDALGLPEGKGH